MLHVNDSLESGSRKIMIRTVDTDVVVILIGKLHNIVDNYPAWAIWNAYPEVNEAFVFMLENSYAQVE